MPTGWISFTTDYGLQDGFVAACKGVIARIAPEVGVIDVTHAVPAQDVRRGALVLAQTVPYLPPGVHLAVVDPGVGTGRRGVVVVAAGGLLVGPDNGLLVPAAEALGGVRAAHELTAPEFRLPEVSTTFHGRDVFAPAAAHLAAGVPADRMGAAVDPATLVRLPPPVRAMGDGRLDTEVVGADGFGNVQLAATAADLAAADLGPRVRVLLEGSGFDAAVVDTFADVQPDALAVLVDSAGQVALAVNRGSAAEWLNLRPGRRLSLVRA